MMAKIRVRNTPQVALVDTELEELLRDGAVEFECSLNDSLTYIQPASIDIPVGSLCYLVKEKVLPFGKTVSEILPDLVLEKRFIDEDEGVTLLKGQTYLVKCGKVHLTEEYVGSLSPKSSIGRIDLMVRGIFDEIGLYDTISCGDGSKELWLEVSPRSFNVKIRKGIALSQMMVFKYRACIDIDSSSSGIEEALTENVIFSTNGEALAPSVHRGNLVLSLSLTNYVCEDESVTEAEFSSAIPVCYEALPTNEVIDLSRIRYHKREIFFRPVFPHPSRHCLTLEKDKFYILSTKEKIRIPTNLSAEMIPFSQHVGELRAHYAGFFDPGFGCAEEGKEEGTIGVLEVRPHETITVYDGQPICLMEFYLNSRNPAKPYGYANNNYGQQTGPKLAKFFA